MKGEARTYHVVRVDEPGTATCQRGGEVSKAAICGAVATQKLPRARLRGGWWNVWLCPRGHRFAERQTERTRQAMDVPEGKPVFGETP